MSTIVNNLSNFYYDFYVGDGFSLTQAQKFFERYDDIDRHSLYIKEIYETILSSSTINETSKIKIKSRKTYIEIARFYNSSLAQRGEEETIPSSSSSSSSSSKPSSKPQHLKTPELVKADIYYTNRKLSNILRNNNYSMEYPQKDFFSLILYQPKLSETQWSEADEALERLKVTLTNKPITKEAFWLNIPAKEYSKELSEVEFSHLLNLIQPYFNSQKSLAQYKLNNMRRECGYLNYILRANINTLAKIDRERREIIQSLCDKKQLQEFKEGDLYPDSILYQYQVQLSELREELERDKQTRMDLMSKVGQIYHQTAGNLSEKHKFAVDALGKQYEEIKQLSHSKQQRITQLEQKIEEIRKQEEERQKISNNQ